MTVSAQKKWLISLILDMSDEQVAELNEYAIRNQIGYDENEPPLNDDEIEGLKIAKQESSAGETIPLSEVLKELYD